jgi:hypothetical protein
MKKNVEMLNSCCACRGNRRERKQNRTSTSPSSSPHHACSLSFSSSSPPHLHHTNMSAAAIITSITYALTSSLVLYESYKQPVPNELTPYLHLINLLPIWTQIIPLWTTRPVPVRWVSRLGGIVRSEDRGTIDPKVVELVDRALITYQTTCAFLIGILVVPFIWISRHTAIQQDESSANAEYKSIVLWLIVLGTWMGCCLRKLFFLKN